MGQALLVSAFSSGPFPLSPSVPPTLPGGSLGPPKKNREAAHQSAHRTTRAAGRHALLPPRPFRGHRHARFSFWLHASIHRRTRLGNDVSRLGSTRACRTTLQPASWLTDRVGRRPVDPPSLRAPIEVKSPAKGLLKRWAHTHYYGASTQSTRATNSPTCTTTVGEKGNTFAHQSTHT